MHTIFILLAICVNLLGTTVLAQGGWTKTSCNITSEPNIYECFHERDCTNLTLSTTDPNLRNACEPCTSYHYDSMDTCQDLMDNQQTGDCCHYGDHCCTEIFEWCKRTPTYDEDNTCKKSCCNQNKHCTQSLEKECYDMCIFDTTKYQCNFQCVQNITSYYCVVKNETCFDMRVNITTPNVDVSTSFVTKCYPNDLNCINNIINRWNITDNTICWYKMKSEVYTFRFDEPCTDQNIDCTNDANDGLSGGATSGIVISVLVGLVILIG